MDAGGGGVGNNSVLVVSQSVCVYRRRGSSCVIVCSIGVQYVYIRTCNYYENNNNNAGTRGAVGSSIVWIKNVGSRWLVASPRVCCTCVSSCAPRRS